MRTPILALLAVSCGFSQTAPPSSDAGDVNLVGQKIGPNDLIAIAVYDSPEFSRTVRVGTNGKLILPLMKNPISAAGLLPSELEARIADALRSEELLNEPIVNVTVTEYQSRPITVSGAVRTPTTFQAVGTVRLMDAINKAGGIAAEAGPEALISSANYATDGLVRRVLLKHLLDATDPTLDIVLEGGDEVRIPPLPPVGRVFVLGNIKNANSFPIQDPTDSTVLHMLALAGGFATQPPANAYIIRLDDPSQARRQISIPIKDMLKGKAGDIPLVAHDILYVPKNGKYQAGLAVKEVLSVVTSAMFIFTIVP